MNRQHLFDMMSRVEGHGRLELTRDGNQVVGAKFSPFESPRLFEALLLGRHFEEIPEIVCRVCSICSTVHKVAALQAIERAAGITVSQQTALLRELAVLGGQIESHALHVFCLALPDYLGVNGFPQLAKVAPEFMKTGLAVKKLGNMLQEVIGGRAIHPFNLLLGGMGRVPGDEELRQIARQFENLLSSLREGLEYVRSLAPILPELPPVPLCAGNSDGLVDGDAVRTSLGELIEQSRFAQWCNEITESDGTAKVSNFIDGKPYVVGPIARVVLGARLDCISVPSPSIVWSQFARTIELESALCRVLELIDVFARTEWRVEHIRSMSTASGKGESLVEAPRGVLYHQYVFDDSGICCNVNIITPTAINQLAINTSLQNLLTAMSGCTYEDITFAVEALVRCFDPCISCAVH